MTSTGNHRASEMDAKGFRGEMMILRVQTGGNTPKVTVNANDKKIESAMTEETGTE